MLGTLCRRKMLTTDASLTDWGAILEGRSSQVLWKDHHLSWHINCPEMLAVFFALKNFLADLRAHHVLLHKSPGGFEVTSTLQTGLPNLPVVPREVVVSSSSLHPGGPRYRSRHPVETGAEVRGIEAPPRGGGADIEGVRPYTSRSVCRERRLTFHSGSPSRIQLLSDWTQWCRRGQGFVCMHFPPIDLLPGVLEKVRRDRVLLLLIAPRWPGRVWFPDILFIFIYFYLFYLVI